MPSTKNSRARLKHKGNASTQALQDADITSVNHAREETIDTNDESIEERTEVTAAAPSFKGRLQQYQFSNVTSTSRVLTKPTPIRKSLRLVQGEDNRVTKPSSPLNKKRSSSKYAPPSIYAHLKPLTDILAPNLICVFIGFNPGISTATSGHAYAHPSNLFWRLLHRSGLTDRLLKPFEDGDLPRLYSMGNTNLVSRPSRDTAELSKEEQVAGVPVLDAKIRKYKPEAVCIVGKSIWESIWKYRYGSKPSKAEFRFGWQEEKHNMGLLSVKGKEVENDGWPGTRVFVATSTSGLDASKKPAEKVEIWRPFGEWVRQRRQERAISTST